MTVIHKQPLPPITIKQWGNLNGANDWRAAFENCNVGCTATDGFGKAGTGKKVIEIREMFANNEIPNWGGEFYWNLEPRDPQAIHIEDWDISGVDDLTLLFSGRLGLTGDLADWDVGHVIYFSEMFYGSPVFNTPLNNWTMSSAEDIAYMLAGCEAFNQPLNGWDTSSIKDMGGLFSGAISFNQPLYNWDISYITYYRYVMSYMFYGATSFDQDLSCWDVSRSSVPANSFATNCPINGTTKMPKWGQTPNTGCV